MAKSRRLSPVYIRRFFAKLPDPRRRISRVRYRLLSLVVIAICATIAGANDNEEIALFARTLRVWLARLVELPESPEQVPSHDTFDRVLSALDPIAFQKCLLAWLHALHENMQGLIAIDGKAAREAMARAGDQGPLTLVSAWASANHLFLGQVAGARAPTNWRRFRAFCSSWNWRAPSSPWMPWDVSSTSSSRSWKRKATMSLR
ncbi:MAG: ISAs1 family transposase [Planctomycetes bacterium]|nr:ISAs1 family transposase [Planctomycetota bacterium]